MLEPSPDKPAHSPNLPQTFERRAFVRYSHRFSILWQLLGMAAKDLTSARVFDLSTTGVGLILDREFPVGKVLILRLPSSTRGWNSHLVRVKYCRLQADGQFQIGCSFTKPLSAVQLESHLQI
jgi:hypothetical protein